MRELHNSGNYATLVRQRYAEKGKLRGEEDYTKLISMMERRYGHADKKESMLKIFDEALKVDPVIEVNPNPQEHETDTMATFTTEQGPVKVYLMKSGLWGFHL